MKAYCKSKIHRATVTDSSLNYSGSITIGKNMLDASGIENYELVHINNLNNAAHWETYVVEGEDNMIILNGAPARLFHPGDLITVLSLEYTDRFKEHTVVLVDDNNNVTEIKKTNL
jgi:aspartate 1-decarboxylase